MGSSCSAPPDPGYPQPMLHTLLKLKGTASINNSLNVFLVSNENKVGLQLCKSWHFLFNWSWLQDKRNTSFVFGYRRVRQPAGITEQEMCVRAVSLPVQFLCCPCQNEEGWSSEASTLLLNASAAAGSHRAAPLSLMGDQKPPGSTTQYWASPAWVLNETLQWKHPVQIGIMSRVE